MGGVGVSAYLSLILRRRGGCLFEAGRLLTFSAFRMGAYSRWALIRGWALIRINTVHSLWLQSICPSPLPIIGTYGSDDGDSNEKVKQENKVKK